MSLACLFSDWIRFSRKKNMFVLGRSKSQFAFSLLPCHSLLAEVSHDEAEWNDRREISAGFWLVSYHACARVSLTTSDVFVTCDTTKRTGLRACHVFDLLCNQSSLSLCQTDLPKFLKLSFQWLIFRFLRLCTFININVIFNNNEFRFKTSQPDRVQKTSTHMQIRYAMDSQWQRSLTTRENKTIKVRTFGCLPFVRMNRLERPLNNAKDFSKTSKPIICNRNQIALTICNSISRNSLRLMRDSGVFERLKTGKWFSKW